MVPNQIETIAVSSVEGIRKIFWVSKQPEKKQGKGASISMGHYRPLNNSQIDQPHITYHGTAHYHLTSDKKQRVSTVKNGGLDILNEITPFGILRSEPISNYKLESEPVKQALIECPNTYKSLQAYFEIVPKTLNSVLCDKNYSYIIWDNICVRYSLKIVDAQPQYTEMFCES